MTSTELTSLVETAIADIKGFDIQTIDVRGKSSITDFMMICSGTSVRHTCAISEKVKDALCEHDVDVRAIEGRETGEWVLMDAGDVILHIFTPEAREIFQLEKLYLY